MACWPCRGSKLSRAASIRNGVAGLSAEPASGVLSLCEGQARQGVEKCDACQLALGHGRMLFTSHLFIFLFLPSVVLACRQAQRRLDRTAALVTMIAASLLFYWSNSRAQISVLLASLAFNCFLNWCWFETTDEKSRRVITLVLIVGNLACLGYYKYGDFIVEQFSRVARDQTLYAIALPLGISFFTFQQIAYAADVAAGRVKEH